MPIPSTNKVRISVWRRSWADNLRIWQEIIWHCCQNDRLFQNKWPKRPTHATYASDMWSSILQFVHNLFWLKLKWNAISKLFYCIIYRSSMLWWSSRTLTKLKSQSLKRCNEQKYYTIDDFRWGEYKDWSTYGTWYSPRHPRWISCSMGWSILVFTEIESH